MVKVSQKDIAAALRVSRVTVTKALKGHPDVAEVTKRLVEKKAEELGYIPDFIGRSLSAGQTYTIGVILPKIAHSFFSMAIERFYEYANVRGYNIIPMISFEDRDKELANIQTLLSMRVDGIIIDIAGNTPEDVSYEQIKRTGTKLLFFDRMPVRGQHGAILNNDRQGAYMMTRRLIEKGYKKIYHFAGRQGLGISAERQRGYEDAMGEAGLLKYILSTDMMPQSGYNALMHMAKNDELPDAIFTVNDSTALGVYDALNELGLSIPDDVAVAGFGDIDISRLLNPPLTSVQMPVDDMAHAAINMLVDMIEKNEAHTEQKIFTSKIVERSSI